MSRFYAIHRMLIQEKQQMNEMMKQIKIENEIYRNKEMLERLNKNMNKLIVYVEKPMTPYFKN